MKLILERFYIVISTIDTIDTFDFYKILGIR